MREALAMWDVENAVFLIHKIGLKELQMMLEVYGNRKVV